MMTTSPMQNRAALSIAFAVLATIGSSNAQPEPTNEEDPGDERLRRKAVESLHSYFRAVEDALDYYGGRDDCHARCAARFAGRMLGLEVPAGYYRWLAWLLPDGKPEGFPGPNDSSCRRAFYRVDKGFTRMAGVSWIGFNCKAKFKLGGVFRYVYPDEDFSFAHAGTRLTEMDDLTKQQFDELWLEHALNPILPLIVDDFIERRAQFGSANLASLRAWRAERGFAVDLAELAEPSWRLLEWTRQRAHAGGQTREPPILRSDLSVHGWGAILKDGCGLVIEDPEEVLRLLDAPHPNDRTASP